MEMFKSFWHTIPMVRLLILLIAGILIGYNLKENQIAIWICCGMLIPGFFLIRMKRFNYYRKRFIKGIGIALICIALGILAQWKNYSPNNPTHYLRQNNFEKLLVKINDDGIITGKRKKYTGTVIAIREKGGVIKPSTGNLMLYFYPDITYTYSEVIELDSASLKRIKSPLNPGEFDMHQYFKRKNIFHTAIPTKTQHRSLHIHNGSWMIQWVNKLKNHFGIVLQTYVISAEEIAVAKALLYGFDDAISYETTTAYAQTGTLHVLAVSGMHVGIIFWILGLLCKPLEKSGSSRIIKSILILCALWFYSLLCGMTPSILRATVMFSFIVVGSSLGQQGNIFNNLAGSAFFLLVFNPNILADVGFQLSYLAVGGIVAIQPVLYQKLNLRNRFLDSIWNLVSVSVAAQLATCPLGLYYFHQFPNSFILSNLLIIPITTVILYLLIVLMSFSLLPVLATFLGKLIFFLIRLSNSIAIMISNLPYSFTEGIQISFFQSFLLFILLSSVVLYLISKRATLLLIGMGSTMAILSENTYHKIISNNQNKLIIYCIPNHLALQFMQGSTSTLFVDSTLVNDKKKIQFHTANYSGSHFVKKPTIVPAHNKWSLIQLPEIRIILTGNNAFQSDSTSCDIVVIRNPVNLESLNLLKPKRVVMNSNLSYQLREKYMAYYRDLKIPYYNLPLSGAIELNLNAYE